jgi:hypothetical protein
MGETVASSRMGTMAMFAMPPASAEQPVPLAIAATEAALAARLTVEKIAATVAASAAVAAFENMHVLILHLHGG